MYEYIIKVTRKSRTCCNQTLKIHIKLRTKLDAKIRGGVEKIKYFTTLDPDPGFSKSATLLQLHTYSISIFRLKPKVRRRFDN